MNISIISASNRAKRQSHRVSLHLLQRLQQMKEHSVELIDLAAIQLPLFEETLSNHAQPPLRLQQLQEAIIKADAFLFVSPEYNGSYTSALKNAVEYLDEKTFQKKAIGIVSVTTGVNGGIRGGMQMQQLALSIWSVPTPAMLLVPQVDKMFDEAGQLLDESFDKKINFFLKEYLWLAEAIHEKRNQAV